MRERDPVITAIESLPPLREVIAGANLNARKNLGQNFLLDLNLTGKIAAAAAPIADDEIIIEIGPGPGGLTRALLMAGAKNIIAIEADHRAATALQPLADAAQGRLRIIRADALAIDIAEILKGGTCKIIANLPYNIATALLLQWLDRLTHIKSMTLMFQKEVAERITAAPDTKAYGRLAVICQWLCEAEILFDIPPQAFTPQPKITSSVVRLSPRAAPLAEADKKMLEDVTRSLFGHRRKMLRASLKGLCDNPKELLAAIGIIETARAETLSIEKFCALANALNNPRAEQPQNHQD